MLLYSLTRLSVLQLGGKYFKEAGRLHKSPPKGKLLLSGAALMGGVVSSIRYISVVFVFLRPTDSKWSPVQSAVRTSSKGISDGSQVTQCVQVKYLGLMMEKAALGSNPKL